MNTRQLTAAICTSLLATAMATRSKASDHLDSPATVANPQADVSDVYAWTSADGQQLNLVMTVLGHSFSDRIEYALHVDSGKAFGHTTTATTITCHFTDAKAAECKLGDADSASGDPTQPSGIQGRNKKFRVYAGLRDDPFYNNVKGLLGAYQAGGDAIKHGATVDASSCAHFDAPTSKAIREQMSHTDGGAAQNLLQDWTVSAIVISVDLDVVSKGGKLLAVSGTTSSSAGVVFCGINPGMTAALSGHHFSSPSNRFWQVIHRAGFTPLQILPQNDRSLLEYGCGLTTAVARPTRRADELSAHEFVHAAEVLRRKVTRYAPRAVAFLGKAAYSAITRTPLVQWGARATPFAGAMAWVVPNPSGLNRNFRTADLVKAYRQLRLALLE